MRARTVLLGVGLLLLVAAVPNVVDRTSTTTEPSTTTTTGPSATTTSTTASTPACPATERDRPGGPDGFGGCWPDESSTGVLDATALTVMQGDLAVSTPGTVIDGKDIRGCVRVDVPNVTIRNSKISCNDFYVVLREDRGGDPLLLEDVEITCNSSNGTAIGYNSIVARRVHIHGCENGFDVGNDMTITESYLDDFYEGAAGHADGIQMQIGVNIKIEHNSIVAFASTSAIISDPDANSNVLITRNLLAGGAYTLYCPRDRSVDYRVIDNRFSRILYPDGGAYGPWTDCNKIAVNRDNRWADTLQPLP